MHRKAKSKVTFPTLAERERRLVDLMAVSQVRDG